jgi:hypothetical protein
MKEKATIFINLEGLSFEHARRCEAIIRSLFEAGVMGIKSGNVTIHFDKFGYVGQIDLNFVKWRAKEKDMDNSTIERLLENAIIELTPQTHEKEQVI